MNEIEWLEMLSDCIDAYKSTALSGLDEYSPIYKSAKIAYEGLAKYVNTNIQNRIKRLKEGEKLGDS